MNSLLRRTTVLLSLILISSCSGLQIFSLDRTPPAESGTEQQRAAATSNDEVDGEDMLVADEAQPLNGAFLACGFTSSQDDVDRARRRNSKDQTVEVACGAYNSDSKDLITNYSLSFETILIDGSEPSKISNSFENNRNFHITVDIPEQSLRKGIVQVIARTRVPQGELKESFLFSDLLVFEGNLPDGIRKDDRIDDLESFAGLVERTYTFPDFYKPGALNNDADEDQQRGLSLQGGLEGLVNSLDQASGLGSIVLGAEQLCDDEDTISEEAMGINALRSVFQSIFGASDQALQTLLSIRKQRFGDSKIETKPETCIQKAPTKGSERPPGSLNSKFISFHRNGNGKGCAVLLAHSLDILDGTPSNKDKLIAFIAHNLTNSQFLAMERFAIQMQKEFGRCK